MLFPGFWCSHPERTAIFATRTGPSLQVASSHAQAKYRVRPQPRCTHKYTWSTPWRSGSGICDSIIICPAKKTPRRPQDMWLRRENGEECRYDRQYRVLWYTYNHTVNFRDHDFIQIRQSGRLELILRKILRLSDHGQWEGVPLPIANSPETHLNIVMGESLMFQLYSVSVHSRPIMSPSCPIMPPSYRFVCPFLPVESKIQRSL